MNTVTTNIRPIFVSYARHDREIVEWLFANLQEAGIPVWIDRASLKAGTPDWEQELRAAIRDCAGVLLVASPESRESRYVRDELAIATMYKRPIYPIWVAGDNWIEAIPLGFGKTQYIDFRGQRAKDAFLELLRVLPYEKHNEITHKVTEPEFLETPQNGSEISQAQIIDGEAALEAASIFRDKGQLDKAIPEYLKALKDTEKTNIRVAAIRALGQLRWKNDVVLEALTDPSSEVRQEAALALTRIGVTSSKVPLQITALQDSSIAVRLYASVALMLYNSPDLVTKWLNDLASGATESTLKKAISSVQLRLNELLNITYQHVFISYTRRDSEQFVINLAQSLRETGFSIWIDTNLQPGTPVWMHEIEKAIQQAGICIVILSPAIHESEWVPKEVSFAKQFKKPIIPIKYLETHKPLYLSTDQGLRDDLPFAEQPEKMLKLLIDALDKLVDRIQ